MKTLNYLRKKYPLILYSVVLTPILAFVSILTVGAEGHGSKIIFKFLYPYTLFVVAGLQIEDNELMAIIGYIGFFLYVYYGIILTIANKKGKIKETLRILMTAHITAAIFCIFLLA